MIARPDPALSLLGSSGFLFYSLWENQSLPSGSDSARGELHFYRRDDALAISLAISLCYK